MEPDKVSSWQWFDWNQLPQELFSSLITFRAQGGNPLKSFLQPKDSLKERAL